MRTVPVEASRRIAVEAEDTVVARESGYHDVGIQLVRSTLSDPKGFSFGSAITVDMIDGQELVCGFAATGAASAIGVQYRLLECPSLLSSLCAYLYRVSAAVFATVRPMTLTVLLFPRAGFCLVRIGVFLAMLALVGDVCLMVLGLALQNLGNHALAILQIPRALTGAIRFFVGHVEIIPKRIEWSNYDGHAFVNMSRLLMLAVGAVRQIGLEVRTLRSEIRALTTPS